MHKRPRLFKLLKTTIILLALVLIAINVLYLKTVCLTRQCFVINIATMLLLLWVAGFWLLVVKYVDKERK